MPTYQIEPEAIEIYCTKVQLQVRQRKWNTTKQHFPETPTSIYTKTNVVSYDSKFVVAVQFIS